MHSFPRLPRVLVTNDDGIDAPGIATLIEVAQEFANEVWVVAPRHDESGTGQSLSLHHPLRAWECGENCWSVSGTPADCVALALGHLMIEARPTLILSGINAGTNLGDDVNLSGTLGAAFTGLLLDVPSIAISQECVSRHDAPWETSREIVPKLLAHFLATGWRKDTCLSINIPNRPAKDIAGFSWARPDARTLGDIAVEVREDMREQTYYWLSLHDREPNGKDSADVAILRRGEVAVSALVLDRSVKVDAPSVIFDDEVPETETESETEAEADTSIDTDSDANTEADTDAK